MRAIGRGHSRFRHHGVDVDGIASLSQAKIPDLHADAVAWWSDVLPFFVVDVQSLSLGPRDFTSDLRTYVRVIIARRGAKNGPTGAQHWDFIDLQ